MTTEIITARNEWDETVEIHLIAGDRERGIGYAAGVPVLVYAGVTQPAARPGETWFWGDGSGRGWKVVESEGREPYWTELRSVPSAGSGALQY
jgi:hypothetical protein